MSEVEKRQFDVFRSQKTYPAASYDSLPEEVQNYIGRLEMEIYDEKQQRIAGYTFFFCAVGAVSIILMFFGYLSASVLKYSVSTIFLVVPWFVYSHQFKKNAQEFMPSGPNAVSPTNEAFGYEWEMNYLNLSRRQAKENLNADN